MALKTARSTPDQRQALLKLHDNLQEALDSVSGRYWLTHEQGQSYRTVLAHLQRWAEYESDEKEENHDG